MLWRGKWTFSFFSCHVSFKASQKPHLWTRCATLKSRPSQRNEGYTQRGFNGSRNNAPLCVWDAQTRETREKGRRAIEARPSPLRKKKNLNFLDTEIDFFERQAIEVLQREFLMWNSARSVWGRHCTSLGLEAGRWLKFGFSLLQRCDISPHTTAQKWRCLL